jgi:thiol-disulfide isomerase/thioredoxin
MIRRISSIVLVFVLLGGLAGCRTDKHSALVGHPFPAFRFPASGSADSVSLDKLKGNAALVVFWATWCGPCQEEVAQLRQVLETYQSKGLQIVGLSIDETAAPVPLMIQHLSIPYPVGTGALPLFDSLKLQSIPQIYLLDSKGVVVDDFGGVPASVIGRSIDKLLAAK